MKVPAGEKSSSRYIQESSDYAMPVQGGGGSFDGTVLYNHWRRECPMLDAALQPSTCASLARRDNLVRGLDEESARTTIAELCGVIVRDVDAVCIGRCVRNRYPSNKTLGTFARLSNSLCTIPSAPEDSNQPTGSI